jgi:homoserine O-acetyltransferase/O-succinyltransferase
MMREAVHVIPRFQFESGATLEDMRVGYVTHGALNARMDNAILVTHGTSANRHTFDPYIGPDRAFDTHKYFVIAVDAIGGGTSSSPKDGLGIDFPRYTIRDMVRAQHDLVTNAIGLPGIRATGGSSMGAFQALEWGILFPDFVRGLLLIVPAARAPNNIKAVIDTMFEIVKLDSNWNGGRYTQNPTQGLAAAGMVFGTWFLSDLYLESMQTPAAYQEALMVMAKAYVEWDAVSLIWRYLASREHDASRPFAGDMKQALARVKAKTLVMPSATDRVLPLFGAHELRDGIAGALYAEIPSIMGHMAQNPADTNSSEHRFAAATISDFLAKL